VLPDFSDEDVNPDIGVKMCAALGILQILQSFFVKSPAHGDVDPAAIKVQRECGEPENTSGE